MKKKLYLIAVLTVLSEVVANANDKQVATAEVQIQKSALNQQLSDLQRQKDALTQQLAGVDKQINELQLQDFKSRLIGLTDRLGADIKKLGDKLSQATDQDLQGLHDAAVYTQKKLSELKDNAALAFDKNKQRIQDLLIKLSNIRIFQPSVVQKDGTVSQKEAPLASSANDLSALSKEFESVLIPLRNK